MRARALLRKGDAGSGTVLAIGLVGVVSTVLVAALLVSAVAIAGQRARTAADLAALAAAGAALTGADAAAACAAARELTSTNGAVLTRCELVPAAGGGPAITVPGLRPHPPIGPVVELTVTREVAGTAWRVTARARAGGVPDT